MHEDGYAPIPIPDKTIDFGDVLSGICVIRLRCSLYLQFSKIEFLDLGVNSITGHPISISTVFGKLCFNPYSQNDSQAVLPIIYSSTWIVPTTRKAVGYLTDL